MRARNAASCSAVVAAAARAPTVGAVVDEGVRLSLEGKLGGEEPLARLGGGDGAPPELLFLPFEERVPRRPLVGGGGAESTTGSGRGPSLRNSSASAWRYNCQRSSAKLARNAHSEASHV